MPESYEVLFSGEIISGADEQKVKRLAMKAFHATPEQLAKLFSGKAVILKSNLSEEAAQTFQKKLKGIGLVCEIRIKGQTKAPKKPKQPVVEQSKPVKPESIPEAPTASKTGSATWDIAPAGADVNPLKGPEPPPAPDTSQFEIKPQEGYLVEPDNAPAPEVPDTSHITLE